MTDEEFGRAWAKRYGIESYEGWDGEGWDWANWGPTTTHPRPHYGLPRLIFDAMNRDVTGPPFRSEGEAYACLGRAVRELADILRAIPFEYAPWGGVRRESYEGAYRG